MGDNATAAPKPEKKLLGRDGNLYTREEYITKFRSLPSGVDATEADLGMLNRLAKGQR